MRDLQTLIQDERVNAGLGWAMVFLIVASAGWNLAEGDLLWSGFAAVCALVALLPAAVTRDPEAMLPWEVLGLLAGAVLVGTLGFFGASAGYLATAALALAFAVHVDVFTPVELTSWFSVPFVSVTTIALAAVWSMVRYAADVFLEASFLASNADLMWNLALAAGIGVAAGVLFELYVRRLGARYDGPSAPDSVSSTRTDRVPITESPLRYVVRVMQAVLALVAVYGAVTLNVALFVNATMSLAVTLLPAVARLRYGHPISAGLTLWITTAAFLHTVGALGPYQDTGWYDTVTHTLTATLVAGVGYAVVQALDHHSQDLTLPTSFRVLCIVLFVLAFGVVWELLEFAADGLAAVFGFESVLSQYGLEDTVLDLFFDGVGAVAVALWGTRYFDGVSDLLSQRLRAG